MLARPIKGKNANVLKQDLTLNMQDPKHTHTHTQFSNTEKLVIAKVRISPSFTKLFLFTI